MRGGGENTVCVSMGEMRSSLLAARRVHLPLCMKVSNCLSLCSPTQPLFLCFSVSLFLCLPLLCPPTLTPTHILHSRYTHCSNDFVSPATP